MYQRLGQARAGARLHKPWGPYANPLCRPAPSPLPSVIARAFLRVFTARQKDNRRQSRTKLTATATNFVRARARLII